MYEIKQIRQKDILFEQMTIKKCCENATLLQEAPEEEDGEEEGEEESITISNMAALDSIQNIFNYLQQNSDVKDIQRQIGRKQNAAHVGCWFCY